MVYRPPFQDHTTGSSVSVDYASYMGHSGCSFTCHYNQTVSDTNDRSIISFKTGSSKKIHVTASIFASAAANAYMWEAPTITDNNGATLTVFNRLRSSTVASTVLDTSASPDLAGSATFFTEITMGSVTGGTELTHNPLIAGAPPKALGGDARDEQEWLLKPDTLYAWEIKSSDINDNTHIIELDWYEE